MMLCSDFDLIPYKTKTTIVVFIIAYISYTVLELLVFILTRTCIRLLCSLKS